MERTLEIHLKPGLCTCYILRIINYVLLEVEGPMKYKLVSLAFLL